MAILGLIVSLQTFDGEDSGTDDEIYIGYWGTSGGREFPLSSPNHDDFGQGQRDSYILGVDPGFGISFFRPVHSAPGRDNDPARVPIPLGSIQYVYIRKQAYGRGEDDDAWRLSSVTVLLYDVESVPLPRTRLFALDVPKGMWFGNEHGHQAWLTEFDFQNGARDFVDRLGDKVFQAAP